MPPENKIKIRSYLMKSLIIYRESSADCKWNNYYSIKVFNLLHRQEFAYYIMGNGITNITRKTSGSVLQRNVHIIYKVLQKALNNAVFSNN